MKSTISNELAAIIREAAENEDCSIYEQYSGRCMYGANCFGITIPQFSEIGVLQLIINILGELRNRNSTYPNKEELINELLELNWKERSDNMGRDMIYYFPNIQWPEEEETEEEEEDKICEECGGIHP